MTFSESETPHSVTIPLLAPDGEEYGSPSPQSPERLRTFGIVQLCLYGFFVVAGGPYGIEPSIKSGGPLLTLLGQIIIPIVWGLPIALVTAEFSTAFPQNGGFVVFVYNAFGWWPGFFVGWCASMAGVVNQSSLTLLIISYIQSAIDLSTSLRFLLVCIITLITIGVNVFDISFLGRANEALFVIIMLPFAILIFWCLPGAHFENWIAVVPEPDRDIGRLLSNTLWNMQGFAICGSIAGEVSNPRRTFPLGMFACICLIALNYIIPVLSTTTRSDDWSQWNSGYLSTAAAEVVGGAHWMRIWVTACAATANLSMLLSLLAGNARFMAGMGDLGLIPSVFGRTIKTTDSPIVSLVFISSFGAALALVFTRGENSEGFDITVTASVILGGLAPIVQLIAFLWLRYAKPDVERPYSIPGGWPVAIFCVVSPVALFVFLVVTADAQALYISAAAGVLGIIIAAVYFFTHGRHDVRAKGGRDHFHQLGYKC